MSLTLKMIVSRLFHSKIGILNEKKEIQTKENGRFWKMAFAIDLSSICV